MLSLAPASPGAPWSSSSSASSSRAPTEDGGGEEVGVDEKRARTEGAMGGGRILRVGEPAPTPPSERRVARRRSRAAAGLRSISTARQSQGKRDEPKCWWVGPEREEDDERVSLEIQWAWPNTSADRSPMRLGLNEPFHVSPSSPPCWTLARSYATLFPEKKNPSKKKVLHSLFT